MKYTILILLMLFVTPSLFAQSSNVQVTEVTVDLSDAAIRACASRAPVLTDVNSQASCVLPIQGLRGHTLLSILSSSNPNWDNQNGISIADYENGCQLRVENDNNQLRLWFTAGIFVQAEQCIAIDKKLDQSLVKRVRSLSFKVLVE